MEELDYWRLCDELTVVQAALLLLGLDPGGADANVENWSAENQPVGYMAARTAICNKLLSGRLEGTHIPLFDYDINGNSMGAIEATVDVQRSKILVEDLRGWLKSRGFKTGFFFPEPLSPTDYLDANNSRYAPKLAAAVKAWQAVTDAGNKHPKQALTKWLREHAAELSLSDEEGKPNETGIEEIAKVANWQPGGGAPKVP